MRYLAVLLLAAVTPFAQAANFVSLHQSALKIALPPAAGSYNYKFDTRIGFKQQYAPTGVTGCAIGYATGGCAFPGGGSLALPEFTGYQLQNKEFKIFIPAGTRSFMFSGYAPQRTQSAFALRYGSAPVREAALSGAEYQAAQTSERIDSAFSRLVNERSEQLVVHDGGGTLRFVGGQLDAKRGSTKEGNWLYVRQLSGSPLYDVQGAIDLDMAQYAAGYAKIVWTTSAYPDPVDAPSAGGGTGTVTPQDNATTLPVPATVSTSVVSAAGQPLRLDITLAQATSDVAASPKISTWVAALIPANGQSFQADTWFFRLANGSWASQVPADLEGIAFASQVANAASLKFTPSLDFTEAELRAFNVQVHFGYKTGTGSFVSKGKVWPQ
ncbi:hypothetical protein PMI14_04398 [Acidovorax sp. CF316]|nr:hypothetical protein PMI14_04398 [Acidovorax sp. CF316]